MNNLLTYLDFNGLIIFDTESESSKEFLNDIISQVQKKVLVELLGYDLYLQFETGLNETTILDKWTNLRDGTDFIIEYNNEDYTLHFDGVKEMLKYFIAYNYQIAIANRMTFAGQVKSDFENSSVINQNYNLVKLHNKAVDLFGFAFDNENVNYTKTVKLCNDKILDNSCFNFIYAQNLSDNTTYPKWIFNPKQYIY